MTRQELIAQCRYYKGEEENPFEGIDQNKKMLWFYEQVWVFDNGEVLGSYLDEYKTALKIGNLVADNRYPFSLQALLYNRYEHWGYMVTAQDFLEFYYKYYK